MIFAPGAEKRDQLPHALFDLGFGPGMSDRNGLSKVLPALGSLFQNAETAKLEDLRADEHVPIINASCSLLESGSTTDLDDGDYELRHLP